MPDTSNDQTHDSPRSETNAGTKTEGDVRKEPDCIFNLLILQS
jgi:hypothetical protein